MKCQSLFSGKNKKNIINSSSAEFAQREVTAKMVYLLTGLLDLLIISFIVLHTNIGCGYSSEVLFMDL